jgi:hypothetical protein
VSLVSFVVNISGFFHNLSGSRSLRFSTRTRLASHVNTPALQRVRCAMVRLFLALVILFLFLYVIRLLRGSPPTN